MYNEMFKALAFQNKTLKYDDLIAALGLTNERELEDLIIFNDVIKGRLNPKLREVEIYEWKNDATSCDLDFLSNTLEKWAKHGEKFVELIRMESARAEETVHLEGERLRTAPHGNKIIYEVVSGHNELEIDPNRKQVNSKPLNLKRLGI